MSKAIPEPTLEPGGSLGGILFPGEPITLRLSIPSSAILGVALVIFAKQRTGGKAAS